MTTLIDIQTLSYSLALNEGKIVGASDAMNDVGRFYEWMHTVALEANFSPTEARQFPELFLNTYLKEMGADRDTKHYALQFYRLRSLEVEMRSNNSRDEHHRALINEWLKEITNDLQ